LSFPFSSEQEHHIVLRDRERIGRFDILPVTRDTVRRVHDRYYWGKRCEERDVNLNELEMYAKRNEEKKGILETRDKIASRRRVCVV